MAINLKTAPTWDAVQGKFHTELKPGISRDEVHKFLESAGPWVSDRTDTHIWNSDIKQFVNAEVIHFSEIHAQWFLGYWYFVYNEKDNLLYLEGPVDMA